MRPKDLEEGELEDGELPDEEGQVEGSGGASVLPGGGHGRGAHHLAGSGSSAPTVHTSRDFMPRGSLQPPRSRSPADGGSGSGSSRDIADLVTTIRQLSSVTLQDVMSKPLDTICANLKSAIKRLEQVVVKSGHPRDRDVEHSELLGPLSRRVFDGLKALHIFSGTGAARTQNLEPARMLMKTAMNYRHIVLSAAQKKELEGWVKSSPLFRSAQEEREVSAEAPPRPPPPPPIQRRLSKTARRASAQAAAAAEQQQRNGAEAQQPQEEEGEGAEAEVPSQEHDGVPTSTSEAPPPLPPTEPEGAGAAPLPPPLPPLPQPAPPAARPPPFPPPPAPPASQGSGKLFKFVINTTSEQIKQPPPPQPPADQDPLLGPTSTAAGSKRTLDAAALPPAAREEDINGDGRPSKRFHASAHVSPLPPGASQHTAGGGGGGGGGSGSSTYGVPSSAHQQQPQLPGPPHGAPLRHNSASGFGSRGGPSAAVAPLSPPPPAPRDGAAAATATGDDPATLLRSQRLVLVLDIDHTLLNSARIADVGPGTEARLREVLDGYRAQQLPPAQQELFQLSHAGMWTKLRPGVREFLDRLAGRFELWIHTNGNPSYAAAMLDLLDPSRRYFADRVIAQGLASGDTAAMAASSQVKQLMQGLHGKECVAMIVDDSATVWHRDLRNLFLVERYTYFPAASRHKFGMTGGSLLELWTDECPQTGMLAAAADILERCHALVMDEYRALLRRLPPGATAFDPVAAESGTAPWDVRNVLASERRQVLRGVHLLFSRVIPLQLDPRQHWLWQLAELFGAKCSTQASPDVTHVVAPVLATEKVHWALANGKHVVLPSWLECSIMLWARAHEERFAVTVAPEQYDVVA